MSFTHPFLVRSELIRIILIISLIYLLAACQNNGQINQSKGTSEANTAAKWLVILHTTGGLRGENMEISVDHQSVAQFTNSRAKITKTSQISTLNLSRLAKMIKNYTPITNSKSSKTATCRDCYYYSISIEYDGKVSRQQVTDINMDENLKPLIELLKKISSELAKQSK